MNELSLNERKYLSLTLNLRRLIKQYRKSGDLVDIAEDLEDLLNETEKLI